MDRVLKLFAALAAFLFIMDLSGSALAATKDGPQEKAVIMEEVVVTATKTPEKRKDIPNALIIMDETDIQASGAKTIGELLANELGVDWRTYGNYGGAAQEVHIRGMRGNATQVFVNGVSVNSPSLGTADIGKIPLNSIERIEVVKGSGSLLYGSGAMAGTVSIFTKRPQKDKMDLKAGAGYGSQNTYRLAAEQGMFIAGDVGYYLTAGRTETDGFRDNSALRQTDASLKLVLDKRDAVDISLYGDFIDRKYGMPGVKPPAGTQDYAIGGVKFYSSEAATLTDNSQDKDRHVVLEIKSRPIQWLSFDLKGHYMSMENYNYQRYAFNGTGAENWMINRVLGTDGHVEISPFEGAKLLLGGEYKDFEWKNQKVDLDATGSPTSIVKTETHAHLFTRSLFTEVQYRPSTYVKALAGYRHEEHSAFGTENLPRFGLVINPFKTTALKVNHGKHFLAPTPNDLYWPADPYTRGNPDLKPEVGWHTDITVEQSFMEDKIFATLSYFHWNVDDKIQWEIDSQGVFSPINLAGYRANGIEGGLRIGPFFDLTLALSYTHLDAEEENRAYTRQDFGFPPFFPPDFRYDMVKRRAAYTPDQQFKGELTYRSDFGLTVTATARYTSDRVMYRTETTVYPDTQTVTYTLSPYWTADLKVEQRLFKHWILSLSGSNLFGQDYDTYLSPFTDQSKPFADPTRTRVVGYPGSGRSIFAGMTYEY